jgi:hypothetical protein
LRSKHYYHGIYFTLGPHDVFPMDQEIFKGQVNTPAADVSASKANLEKIDEAVNKLSNGPPADFVPEGMQYTSLETVDKDKFKEYGYYYHMGVIYAQ